MKNIKIFLMFVPVFLTFLIISINCKKKPTAPVRNNPSDVKGSNFNGSPPVAAFTITPTAGDIGQLFNFDASASSDNDEPADSLQVRWDWDGNGSYDTNYSTTQKVTHHYVTYGTKDVILQVKDSSGLTDTTSKQIQITDLYKDMVYVHADTFIMGSTDGYLNEQPPHMVYLDAFYIDKYEVTNEQYTAYLTEALNDGEIYVSSIIVNKDSIELLDLDSSLCQISYSNGNFIIDIGKESYPVIEVTWYGAEAYAQHYSKRLPTEAEWEYAAYGGNQSNGYTYSGSNNPDDVGWYSDNADNPNNDMNDGQGTHIVGLKQSNELGIYDMSGNVWEWCHDWYDGDYYSSVTIENPQGPKSGKSRILRGGSWRDNNTYLRSAHRSSTYPDTDHWHVGFRCVR